MNTQLSCRLTFLLLLGSLFLTQKIKAQTLNESLIKEDPVKLTKDARNDGDIVRGAILFHQGNINCVKCHRPTSEADRIGPDLSNMGPDVTDQHIIESILQPSKVIKKEYVASSILMLDGRVFTGTILSQNDASIVIRDAQDTTKKFTLARGDIEAIEPSNISTMPANLVDELKNRKQFLDLLRYVIDIHERGPATDKVVTKQQVQRELSVELTGLVAIEELNCAACHENDLVATSIESKAAPDLNWSAANVNPDYLKSFIVSPSAQKTGSTMPDLLGGLDGPEKETAATALTHFLLSKSDKRYQHEPIDSSAIDNGFTLFHEVGCVACHSPRNPSAQELNLPDSVPLGDLKNKYNVTSLVNFLEDPLAVRRSGHMPNMKLQHREAIDISNYLLQKSTDDSEAWQVDEALVKEGRVLFQQHNCANCHNGVVQAEDPAEVALSRQQPMSKLDVTRGCLAEDRQGTPNFHLSPQRREAIQTTLKTEWSNLSDTQQIDLTVTAFRCLACHDRDRLGGVAADRDVHFKTGNLNLGDQGRIPPTLSGVGAKLQTKWMRDVLVNGRSIRPYIKTRMPQFGEGNIGHIVELFDSVDQLGETEFATFEDRKVVRKTGLQLAGNKGLNCVACHTYKYKLSDTMPAVDLTEMAERLHKDWFYQYMRNPQTFSPNTVMPSFWPGGVAIRSDLEGDTDDQIEALWQYLLDGRQAGTPSGVVRKPLEIKVSEEAEMLRRSYPGIGKRGIGVGYPGGLNLAFDAEQMRLGMVWKGRFVDPGGVWTGQGSGRVRPMGQTINFPTGPELDSADEPWEVDQGRPPAHRFRGYELDKARRPTFQYQFEEVAVKDFFEVIQDESSDAKRLRRTISLTAKQETSGLRFRIAGYSKEQTKSGDLQIRKTDDGRYLVGQRMAVQVRSKQKVDLLEQETGQVLQVELNVPANQTVRLVLEYDWD
ncbi:MAG: hypothetical protein AAFN77_21815 [Planctomycetota bacterium]